MSRLRLDQALLDKMVNKSAKSKQYMREQISRRAGKQGISSSAAQLVWAQELGIGIANRLAKVPAEVREEVRSVGAAVSRPAVGMRKGEAPGRAKRKADAITGATIRKLLHDDQLYERCKDLLQAKRHFDRVIREATTVLDDRLKTVTGIRNMNPENLVGRAINPDPSKAIIEVSADRSEQEGMHSICKGIMLAFRNKAHHSLSDKFTREDALKFCSFVDTVLAVINQATIHLDRV